jgi:hypothetical protein
MMQLGTRWAVGDAPPANLPEVVEQAVSTVEADLRSLDTDTADWRWPRTWLEKKPVVELDDGTIIRYNPSDDSATITGPVEQLPDPFDED